MLVKLGDVWTLVKLPEGGGVFLKLLVTEIVEISRPEGACRSPIGLLDEPPSDPRGNSALVGPSILIPCGLHHAIEVWELLRHFLPNPLCRPAGVWIHIISYHHHDVPRHLVAKEVGSDREPSPLLLDDDHLSLGEVRMLMGRV